VPEGASLPYITIGEDRVRFSSVDGILRSEHETSIFIYSQHDGISQVKRLLDDIHHLVESTPLVVAGHQVVLLRVSETRSQRLNDGKSFRGELILRTLIEAA